MQIAIDSNQQLMSNRSEKFSLHAISLLLFSASGTCSFYLVQLSEELMILTAAIAGLLFLASTIMLFNVLDIKLSAKRVIRYLVLMYGIYMIAFFGTLYSGSMGTFTGIFLTGFGSLSTCLFVKKFIKNIQFN